MTSCVLSPSVFYFVSERLQKLLDDDGIPDGEWEETIDEPEMEFDDMTMDLAAARVTGRTASCDRFGHFSMECSLFVMK